MGGERSPAVIDALTLGLHMVDVLMICKVGWDWNLREVLAAGRDLPSNLPDGQCTIA